MFRVGIRRCTSRHDAITTEGVEGDQLDESIADTLVSAG